MEVVDWKRGGSRNCGLDEKQTNNKEKKKKENDSSPLRGYGPIIHYCQITNWCVFLLGINNEKDNLTIMVKILQEHFIAI